MFGISRHHELSGCRALSRAGNCIIKNASNALQRIFQLLQEIHLADQQERGRGVINAYTAFIIQ